MKAKAILSILVILISISCNQQYEFPYQDPSLSFEERAGDLVSRMTLEQKIAQLNYRSPAIEELGVEEYNWWNECLHGVARAGEATVFPQAIAMAAMWDRELMYSIAEVISDEARAKHHEFASRNRRGIYQGLTFWSPNINIFRDPRWGRGMETYGEDPYLTGEMAVEFIRGLQGDDPRYLKLVATSKHYAVHNGPETLRHTFNAETSVRDFRDTYLPAFRKTVLEAGVYSVMCAYNRYMGVPCCGSSSLQNEILREEMGFDGYIVSDCGAISNIYRTHKYVETAEEAAAMAVINGTDLNCGNTSQYLAGAVQKGFITEEEIDIAVKRLMLARMKLGMFDPPEMVPYTSIPYDVVCSEENRRIALDAARKSMVLLKNENQHLPIRKDISKIAVIGPNSNELETMLANYNGTPRNPVTPLQGIREKFNNSEILYTPGCHFAEGLPLMSVVEEKYLFTSEDFDKNGLRARYFNNYEFEGEPVLERVDPEIDFYWWDREVPEPLVNDIFGVIWTGYLLPPKSGQYALGCESKNFELFLNDSLFESNRNVHHPNKKYSFVDLEAGRSYKIEIRAIDFQGDAMCSLIWEIPDPDMEEKALVAAAEADHVILFMGLSPRLEGEEMKVEVEGFSGGDRVTLGLPELQKSLIRKIIRTNPSVTLVLLNGSALSIPWENENIPSILEAWYPGETAGTAIADILAGDYNPAGRLPVSFYNSVNELGDFKDYKMEGKTYRYYRGNVLYPFGYGLSYTQFEYSIPVVNKSDVDEYGKIELSVDITNTGNYNGEETVQVYVSYPDSDIQRPFKELCEFKRVAIQKGETITVNFKINMEDLEYYNEESGSYTVEKGIYLLHIGSSSDDKDLQTIDIQVI